MIGEILVDFKKNYTIDLTTVTFQSCVLSTLGTAEMAEHTTDVFFLRKLFAGRQSGGTANSAAGLQLQGPWFDSELKLLSV